MAPALTWRPQGPEDAYPESERYDRLLASLADPYDDSQAWVQEAQAQFFPRPADRYAEWELALLGACYPYWSLLLFRDRAGKKTRVRHFLDAHGALLTRQELKIYRDAAAERFCLLEVGGYDGGYLGLTDVYSGQKREVREQRPGRSLPEGSLLIAHLRPLSTHAELNCALPLPAKQRRHLMAGLETYRALLADERPGAAVADVLHRLLPDVLELALRLIQNLPLLL